MKSRLEQFESRIETKRSLWLFNFLLAVIIFVNAEVGHLLGVQGFPLSVSIIWSATGFALAAFLLLGYGIWPGIFLGNFAYDFLHLYFAGDTVIGPLFTASIIAFGSLLQSFVGAFIMKKYTSVGYFHTVKDVVVFLIFVGLIACTISCTIGTITLYFYGMLEAQNIKATWATFWLGDSMGIYLFTPLLVVWTLHRTVVKVDKYIWEAQIFIMLLLFIALSFLVFVQGYPVMHFFIPLGMWVSYRFRMYGATLFSFFTMLVAIISTSQGYGAFACHPALDPLPNVVTFLEVIVSTCLVLAACANDKDVAMLKSQNS